MIEYMRVPQAAEILGITPAAVYAAVKKNRIRHTWDRGTLLLDASSVDEYMGKKLKPGRPPVARQEG